MKKLNYLIIVVLTIVFMGYIVFAQEIRINSYSQVQDDRPSYVPWEIIVKYKEEKMQVETHSTISIQSNNNSENNNITISSLGVQSIATKIDTTSEKLQIYSEMSNSDLEIKDAIDSLNIVVLKSSSDEDIYSIINDLKTQDNSIEYAEPNYIYYTTSIPSNDTHTGLLRGLHNYGQTIKWISSTIGEDIKRVNAMQIFSWNSNQNITWTIVAIIDNWVNYNHPDLHNQMWNWSSCNDHNWNPAWWCIHGYNFVDSTNDPMANYNSHGTHIAGTIAATMNNGTGIVGVNPNAKIMALKVGDWGSLYLNAILNAIQFAIHNWAKVINASFGWNTNNILLRNAIENFKDAWWLFITAAWNDGWNNNSKPTYPCNYDLDNIICVAATTQTGGLASFSNYWSNKVHVWAPGVNIYSTILWENETQLYEETFSNVVTGAIPIWWTHSLANRNVKENGINKERKDFGLSLFTNIWNKYENNMNSYIESSTINLSWYSSMLFRFSVKCETDGGIWDKLTLKFKQYNWIYTDILTVTWWTTPWTYTTIGIKTNHNVYFNENFKFRFYRQTDNSGQATGCWVDDINISYLTLGWNSNSYGYMDWTSMASPHVAWLASLTRNFRPDLSYSEIKEAIINNGDNLTSLSWKTINGKRINAYNTLSYLDDGYPPTIPELLAPTNGSVVTGSTVKFERTASIDTWVGLSKYYFELSTWEDFIWNSIYTGVYVESTWISLNNLDYWTYYWRVKSFDKINNDSNYSETWMFTKEWYHINTWFNTIDNAEPNQLYTSNTITLYWIMYSGITLNVSTGQYSINTWSNRLTWITGISTGYSGTKIQLALTSSISFNTITTWILYFGNQETAFSITTRNIKNTPENISFTSINNAEKDAIYTSNIVTITWLEVWHIFTASIDKWDLIINWNLVWTNSWIQNWDKLAIKLTSSSNYSTTVISTLTIGSWTYTYSITTKPNPNTGWGWGGGWWGGGWAIFPTLPTCQNSQLSCINWVRTKKTWISCEWGLLWWSCQIQTQNTQTGDLINTKNNNKIGNIVGSTFSTELNQAYLRAYANWITTKKSIQEANLDGNLIRSHTAKMISEFALMLWKTPNNELNCKFDDISDQSIEMKFYINLSCQLWLMWQNLSNFNPTWVVTRAQFGTMLSRVLRWDKYNNGSPYYQNHLNALKNTSIMTKIDEPYSNELRGRTMLMMLRTNNKIENNEIWF